MPNLIWWLPVTTIHNLCHFGWHRQKIHQVEQRPIGYRIQYARISHTTIYHHPNLYKTLANDEPIVNHKLFRHLLTTHHNLHIFGWLWLKAICWTLPTHRYQRTKGRNRKNILITTALPLHNTALQQCRILHRSVSHRREVWVKTKYDAELRLSNYCIILPFMKGENKNKAWLHLLH